MLRRCVPDGAPRCVVQLQNFAAHAMATWNVVVVLVAVAANATDVVVVALAADATVVVVVALATGTRRGRYGCGYARLDGDCGWRYGCVGGWRCVCGGDSDCYRSPGRCLETSRGDASAQTAAARRCAPSAPSRVLQAAGAGLCARAVGS